jgi:hypothetical protein
MCIFADNLKLYHMELPCTRDQSLFIETVLRAIKNEPKLNRFVTGKRTGKSYALRIIDSCLGEKFEMLTEKL